MARIIRIGRVAAAVSLLAAGAWMPKVGAQAATSGGNGPPAKTEHQRIVEFWTKDRVAQAKPRDFDYDPSARTFRPAKPGTSAVLGASWTKGGTVARTTGRVLFELSGAYYLCSASVVNDDGSAKRSLVLTAGHCAYDETNPAFATNWMFVPDYDRAPAPLDVDGNFCAATFYGCWTAESLVVSKIYAQAGGFNDTAVVHDYAFAVVGKGGKQMKDLDAVVGDQAIAFSESSAGTTTWLFGYPAGQKYKGNDLVYCKGPLGSDPNTGNATYRVACDMTGGSSGGPWFNPFTESDGTGTVMSVNSYGYGGTKSMYGPKFTSETLGMFGVARTVAFGTDVTYP